MENNLSLIPIGGVGDVTKNMYLYEYKNEILIVDCGLGFADETMLGVDLLIPDVTYLKNLQGKKIVGMALTHGHEDHIGGLPYVLPDLPGQISDLRDAINSGVGQCQVEGLWITTQGAKSEF